MARYINKHGFLGRLYLGLDVVDVYVRNKETNKVYPIFSIDLLKPDCDAIAISITLPILKLTVGINYGEIND